jgi:hypothetical protein
MMEVFQKTIKDSVVQITLPGQFWLATGPDLIRKLLGRHMHDYSVVNVEKGENFLS